MIAREQLAPVLTEILEHARGVDQITAEDVDHAATRILALDAPSPAVVERLRLTGRGQDRWKPWETVAVMEADYEELHFGVSTPDPAGAMERLLEKRDDR